MRYSMSFTNATLLHQESLLIGRLYADAGDWGVLRARVLEDNLLQMKRPRSARDIFAETKSRLILLTAAQFALLLDGPRSDQLCVLWLAVCKRYPFIREFARDVVREKYLRLDFEVTRDDYEAFFNGKAVWDEHLDSMTEPTRERQRQIVFKMMREAELLTGEHRIMSPHLSDGFVEAVAADDRGLLSIFPVADGLILR